MYALFPDVGSFFFFFPFLSPFSPPSLFLSLSLSFMFYSWKIFVFKKLASFHNEDPWVLVQFKQLLNFFGLTFLMCKLRMMIHTSHCCFKLHFPDDFWHDAYFYMLICPLCDSFIEILAGWFFESKCSLSYYWVLIDLYIFGQQLFIRCDFCRYFLLVCGLSSNFPDIVFHTAQIFNLNEVQLLRS